MRGGREGREEPKSLIGFHGVKVERFHFEPITLMLLISLFNVHISNLIFPRNN